MRPTEVKETATALRVGPASARIIETMRQYACFDAGSAKKTLTDRVFTLDRPSQAAILRGLFSTDGTVADYGEKSQYVALDSVSLELLQQVQLLLLGFGVKAKIYENRRALGQELAVLPDGKGGVKPYPVQQMHSCGFRGVRGVVFEREIGFLPESRKAEQLAALNRHVGTYSGGVG